MAETATMVGVGAESGVDRGGDGGGGAGGGGGGGGGALVPLPNAAWKGSSKGFGIAAGGFPDKVFVFYFTVYSTQYCIERHRGGDRHRTGPKRTVATVIGIAYSSVHIAGACGWLLYSKDQVSGLGLAVSPAHRVLPSSRSASGGLWTRAHARPSTQHARRVHGS